MSWAHSNVRRKVVWQFLEMDRSSIRGAVTIHSKPPKSVVPQELGQSSPGPPPELLWYMAIPPSAWHSGWSSERPSLPLSWSGAVIHRTAVSSICREQDSSLSTARGQGWEEEGGDGQEARLEEDRAGCSRPADISWSTTDDLCFGDRILIVAQANLENNDNNNNNP